METTRSKWRWLSRIVVAALLLSGVAITVAPVVETFINDQDGQRDVQKYVQVLQTTPPQVLSHQYRAAQQYNAKLAPEALHDPWGAEPEKAGVGHNAYLDTLNQQEVMGRIRVPEIEVDLPIFHDATKRSLAAGVGHMFGSSLPVGGANTHAVLAAHTAMRAKTMFDRLPELRPGDDVFIDVAGQSLAYRVDKISVVEPSELAAVGRIPGGDYITLVTCYTPPGQHKQRLLVRAVRVDAGAAGGAEAGGVAAGAVPAGGSTTIGWLPAVQDWMWPRIGVASVALLIFVLIAASWILEARRVNPKRRQHERVQ